MTSRIVTLTATDIEYQGESIGREITVQINVAGELVTAAIATSILALRRQAASR